jgi:threonine/homoserine/homoserine lactone efflux protein
MGYAGQQAGGGGEGETSSGAAIVFLVLGLGLLALGVQNWRNRADTSEPAVMATTGKMGPAPVAFLALGATLVNPKNLVVLLAAGQAIASSTSGSSAVVVGAVFVLLATLPYTGAAGYAVLGGEGARARLDAVRQWLIAHNRAIVGIVATLIGMVLALKGLAALH